MYVQPIVNYSFWFVVDGSWQTPTIFRFIGFPMNVGVYN